MKTTQALTLSGFALFALVFLNPTLSRGADNDAPIPVTESRSDFPLYAAGIAIGTTGVGPVLLLTPENHFTASLGYSWLSYSRDVSSSDTDYSGKLKFSNFQALVNWHPMAGTFHLSVGAFISNDKVGVTGKPHGDNTYTIGSGTYPASQIGTLKGNGTLLSGAAPFVGLGWAKTPDKSGFGGFFELGVLFISSPKADLSASGPAASDPTFQTNLQQEQDKLNKKLDNYRYFPVIQGGMLYRF